MKALSLGYIKHNIQFFAFEIGGKKKRWGHVDNSFISYFFYKDHVILDPLKILINLKKVIWIVSHAAETQAISLIFFHKDWRFLFQKEFTSTVENLKILLVSKLFGFVSNFKFFVDRLDLLQKSKITNYTQFRLPGVVFLTKRCWNLYKGMFKTFVKFRLISVKSMHYLDVESNAGYSLIINDCSLVYTLFKYIYIINNKFLVTW